MEVYRNEASAITEAIFILHGFVMCQAKPGYDTKCISLEKRYKLEFSGVPSAFRQWLQTRTAEILLKDFFPYKRSLAVFPSDPL